MSTDTRQPLPKSPRIVTHTALLQRLRRVHRRSNETLKKVSISDRVYGGGYWVVSHEGGHHRGQIIQWVGDIEEHAREMGVLKHWESVCWSPDSDDSLPWLI